ncbi:unnamed protein product [Chondrus crispus]|uniref:Uncharacterized protein n=1 Tax=Chondrus crispus TaxID=2769 RepID=R7QD63_CHOCR|nr:unnamed protein product [Chondrus crispus]CDF36447.1 unnamed protein product [Chondrus crispus]|eukprot:XP_005716266.1 unnamed protein product [Chondrus crispus]
MAIRRNTHVLAHSYELRPYSTINSQLIIEEFSEPGNLSTIHDLASPDSLKKTSEIFSVLFKFLCT